MVNSYINGYAVIELLSMGSENTTDGIECFGFRFNWL